MIHFLYGNKRLTFLIVFVFAFILRSYLIHKSPNQNTWIDLNIYIDSGQLISNHVNPYDFNDSKDLREKLRTDSTAFGWQCETQERWNYFANGNLPLTLLFFGGIDSLSTGNFLLYRYAFSFFDAILSALIVLFCMRFWTLKPSFFNFMLLLGLGAAGPMLLLYGTVYPEDKGMQTLLMLLAVYFSKDQKWFLSSLFLGASFAYKGLGIFIAPLALYYAIGSPDSFRLSRKQWKTAVLYTAVVLLVCVVIFAPFFPEILQMMNYRMKSNILSIPSHEAIWVLVSKYFPAHWELLKGVFAGLFAVAMIVVFVFRKFNMAALCGSLLILFTVVLLQNGSTDRMNIAMTFSILLIGMTDLKIAKIIGWYTLLAGSILFIIVFFGNLNEDLSAVYCSIFVLLYFYFILAQWRKLEVKKIVTS